MTHTFRKLGEATLYDWQDNGVGDNTGTPRHVGTVTYVNQAAGYFVVTEGNYSDSVKKKNCITEWKIYSRIYHTKI